MREKVRYWVMFLGSAFVLASCTSRPVPPLTLVESAVRDPVSQTLRCWWQANLTIVDSRVDADTATISVRAVCPTRRDFGKCVEQLASATCSASFDWGGQEWVVRRGTCDAASVSLSEKRNACREKPNDRPMLPFTWPGYTIE